MLSAKDNAAAYNLIEYDIKPYMESTITDDTTRGHLLNSLNAIEEPIINTAPNPPSMMNAVAGIQGGYISIDWAPPTSGVSVTQYSLYRTTTNLNGMGVPGWNVWIDIFNNGPPNPSIPRDPYHLPKNIPEGFEVIKDKNLITTNISSTAVRQHIKEEKSIKYLISNI